MPMTDGEVHAAVAKAKTVYKAACTRARNKLNTEKKRVWAHYPGRDDVELAARSNHLARAEAIADRAEADARIHLIRVLEGIRVRSPEWSDLVPLVRP